MIDARPILALLDLPDVDGTRTGEHNRDLLATEEKLADAIVHVVKATNAELERMVREMFVLFGRRGVPLCDQDIAAVLARPVEIRFRDVDTGEVS